MKLKDKSLTAGDVIFDDNVNYADYKNDVKEFKNITKDIKLDKELSDMYIRGWTVPNYTHYSDTYKNVNYEHVNGWKIHISPTLKNVVKVLKIVTDYSKECETNRELHKKELENAEKNLLDYARINGYKITINDFNSKEIKEKFENSIYYKIWAQHKNNDKHINYLFFKFNNNFDDYNRLINDKNLRGNDDLRGKFIAIYSKNDFQAREIADTLHEKFVDNGLINEDDFINIKNDFQVYPGIYARLTNYYDAIFNDRKSRSKVGINYWDLEAHLTYGMYIDHNIETYEHPFKELRFNGKILPRNVYIINDLFAVKSIIDNMCTYINDFNQYMNNSYFDYTIKLFKNIANYNNIKVDTIVTTFNAANKYDKYEVLLDEIHKHNIEINNEFIKNYIDNNNITNANELNFIQSLVDDNIPVFDKLNDVIKNYTGLNGSLRDFINDNDYRNLNDIHDDAIRKINHVIDVIDEFNNLNVRVQYACTIMCNNIENNKFKFGFNYELTDNDTRCREYIMDLYNADIEYDDVIKYNDIVNDRIINRKLVNQKYTYQTPIDRQHRL